MNISPEVNKLVDHINDQAKSRAIRAANELRNAALHVLRGQRSGRVYRVPFSKKTYTASAPGEAPAVRSGTLRRSWRSVAASEAAGNRLSVNPAIITGVEYAPFLEKGTGRMKPRPFEEPIKERAMLKIIKIYREPYL